MDSFKELGLNDQLLSAVSKLGFEKPSAIQEKTIPLLLSKKTDLVALAQTGTGKTAAFGFPLIQKIEPENRVTQGIVLSPTRELCLQITTELTNYAAFVKNINIVAVYGGASITEQAKKLERGAQIIVATPGRMQDMIRRKLVDISDIAYCILDEADEMLNMGFYEDITEILSHTPKEKSTWLFSATMPKEVATIAKKFMQSPEEITVGNKNESTESVQHEYYLVNSRDRYLALKRLADANPDIFSVVFCRTKRDTQQVAEKLIEDGYNAAALHGDLSQNQRDMVMKAFRNKQVQMLIATDVAARGIDVSDITHVINYQLPDEVEVYTHRSGRTGRAGKSGLSMVIIGKNEIQKVRQIERIIKKKFESKTLPTGIEICEIQLYHLANKIKNVKTSQDIESYLPAIHDVLSELSREDLIKKMISVEFGRFYNYYKNTKDLNVSSSGSADYAGSESSGGSRQGETRFFINIGERDGYDWMSLKDLLKDTLKLSSDDVRKVDVKEGFGFFNTPSEISDDVVQAFSDFSLNGRRIRIEISGKGGGGDRKPRSGGDGGGGAPRKSFSRDYSKDGNRFGRSEGGSRDYGSGTRTRENRDRPSSFGGDDYGKRRRKQ